MSEKQSQKFWNRNVIGGIVLILVGIVQILIDKMFYLSGILLMLGGAFYLGDSIIKFKKSNS
ncbi:hypothetical protein [Ornithinibacillus halophilus]|uniref:Uncharacterized protein n=1 Tax=Ornithinibacillus halophilus TaxID=930117 RepID=A0A1M5NEB0_9BACI|nr:hypothetical protein [Ornithinibacillus halophilus]SHG87797.1 hypothetical protein SAMN05216225_10778 [Ornithinibacillus halophilus]